MKLKDYLDGELENNYYCNNKLIENFPIVSKLWLRSKGRRIFSRFRENDQSAPQISHMAFTMPRLIQPNYSINLPSVYIEDKVGKDN